MRIGSIHLVIAVGVAAVLGETACQTARRPAALLPARQATASALPAAPPPQPQASANLQAPASNAQPAAQPDAVAELIAKAEQEYQTGEDNYKAGHLEAAKQNFDQAFNLLLESSLDLRSDERLQQEFDHVLDGVNGLELEALQQGDGF